jgi:hypothetical protein
MKIRQLIIVAVILLTAKSNAQIKVFSGGSVTIGGTTSPTANAVMHQIIGSNIAFPATTSGVTFAPMIVGYNNVSSASAPDFTWLGDANTGVFHPASDILGFAAGGNEVFRINSTKQILNSNSSSSASTPDFSWDSDPNTGMFRSGADIIGFSTGGSERFRINSNGQLINKSTGGSTLPDYSWYGDENTGMYQAGSDMIAFSTGGSGRLGIYSNGQILSMTAQNSAAYPDFSWASDGNTGIFHPSTSVLAFSTNGSERARFNSSGRFLVNTTVDNGQVSINASDYPASSFSVTLNSDWASGTSVTHVNRANSGNYEVRLNGTVKFYVAGQGWIYSDGNYLGSDKNIKDEIKSIDSAMSKVNKINGVLYKLKVEKQNPSIYGTAQEYMGVIAQDVEAVAPQVVRTLPDGTKAVCYEMLVGLLVEALKEQNVKISQLESDVNNCCSTNQNRIINNPANDETKNTNSSSYIKQNSPNPFSKETLIEFYIAEKGASSSVLVFDMNGKLLKTLKLDGLGKGSITINGNDFQPGMYYYSLIINNKEIDTKKMILTE